MFLQLHELNLALLFPWAGVAVDVIVVFFMQGQLALLHNLFKAALYDDNVSRVRDKSCDLFKRNASL